MALTEGGEGPVASVCTGYLRWRTFRFQTHRVRTYLHDTKSISWDSADHLPGSDVKPCVWAVVEVCLCILGACLPTFPALFHWKIAQNNRRPSRMFKSRSASSSQYPVLTPEDRRLGFRSGVGNAHKEFLRMMDLADAPKAGEKEDGTNR